VYVPISLMGTLNQSSSPAILMYASLKEKFNVNEYAVEDVLFGS